MSKPTFGLLISAVLLASPTLAQPTPDPAPTTAVATAAAAAAKPAPAAPTVSGIVVEGLPKKTCSSRDKECIAVVVAELKEHYPQQLKAFCAQWKMQAVRTQWVNDQLVESLGGNNPPTPTAFGVNSAVSKACAEDRPAQK
ncbi:hypothetical protein [Phenylobacterium sp.]|jgi:hypothetical protein|uniref:hypothetical protein n=1 Tax=Phenylobacterium sp. TaxID=1871053 RepID=UPI002E35D756|nr:hypothetical protein [Phenylobacterium sp.]HEX3366524.1 hypothetical protein [Phenylobacterium sp.]